MIIAATFFHIWLANLLLPSSNKTCQTFWQLEWLIRIWPQTVGLFSSEHISISQMVYAKIMPDISAATGATENCSTGYNSKFTNLAKPQ